MRREEECDELEHFQVAEVVAATRPEKDSGLWQADSDCLRTFSAGTGKKKALLQGRKLLFLFPSICQIHDASEV